MIVNCNWKAIVVLFSDKNIFLEIVKLMERSAFSKSGFQRIVQSNRSHPTIQSKMSFQLTFFILMMQKKQQLQQALLSIAMGL